MPGDTPSTAPESRPEAPAERVDYLTELRTDIEKKEDSVLPAIGRKLSLLGSMDPAQTAELRERTLESAHQQYGELVSLRMEYALRSKEMQARIQGLGTELGTRNAELGFPQSAIEMIQRVLQLFKYGKPNKKGQITTPLLMTYQGITRVHVGGKMIEAIRDIDAYMEIATPAQKEFLNRVRGLLVNGNKPVGDVSWSVETDGLMDIDPYAKAEMAYKQLTILDPKDRNPAARLAGAKITPELARAQKGWSTIGLTGRFFGTIAAGGMAVTAFLANKRQADLPVIGYAGLALLGAGFMPKGKFDTVVDQVKPLLSADFAKLAATYEFHKAAKEWSDIALAINGFRQKNAAAYSKLLKPVKEGKTEEERKKGVEAFAETVTSGMKADSPATLGLKNMLPADLLTFTTIVTTARHRDAQIVMRQYFQQNLGPHLLKDLVPKK